MSIHSETLEELKKFVTDEKYRNSLKRRTREFKPVTPVKEYSGKEIKEIREKNNFTQSYLGEILGVSIKTVQAWECETNKPSGAVKRILQIIEKNPKTLEELEIICNK